MADTPLPNQDDINKSKQAIEDAYANMKFDRMRTALEKSLNISPIMKEYEKEFGKSADELNKSFKEALKDSNKTGTMLETKFQNFVRTKERSRFLRLKKDYGEMGKLLTAQVRKQETAQKNLEKKIKIAGKKGLKDEEKNLKKIMEKKKIAIQNLTKFKKTKLQEVQDAEFKARSSEGKVGFAERMKRQMTSGPVKAITAGAAGIPMLGKLIKGMNIWTTALTGLLAVFSALFGAFINKRRDVENMSAAFRNAGLSASDTSKAVTNLDDRFRKLRDASKIDPSVFRKEILQAFGAFPDALREVALGSKDGAERATNLAFALRSLGKSASDSLKSIGEVSKDSAIDTTEYIRMYKLASGASADSAMGFDDAMNSLLNLTGAMRNVTFNTMETEKMFAFMSGTLKSFTGTMRLSGKEVAEFIMNIGKSTASLGFDKITSMFAFVHGKMPKGSDFMEIAKQGGAFHLQLSQINKIMGGVTKTFAKFSGVESQTFIKAMESVGISLPTTQLEPFVKMMRVLQGTLNKDGLEAFNKKTKEFIDDIAKTDKEFADAVKKGIETFGKTISPQAKIANALKVLADDAVGIPPIARAFGALVKGIEALVNPVKTVKKIYEDIPNALANTSMMNPLTLPLAMLYKINVDRNARAVVAAAGAAPTGETAGGGR